MSVLPGPRCGNQQVIIRPQPGPSLIGNALLQPRDFELTVKCAEPFVGVVACHLGGITLVPIGNQIRTYS
jgi:hypothetical protein